MTTPPESYSDVLARIQAAIEEARQVFSRFTPGQTASRYKGINDPVTEADHAVDAVLRKNLLRDGEGWLSEESKDDLARLRCERVWIVDPLDGTREFVDGIPEFCVSIAYVEHGQPVAGGICNPATGEVFLGSIASGLLYNGSPARVSQRCSLEGASVLASRSEIKRGEWKAFQGAPFKVVPTGSVAYKLARVAAGLADITFTLTPKHEWDVAAGAALVLGGGGCVQTLDRSALRCNRKDPLISGLIACSPPVKDALLQFLSSHLQPAGRP
ncbi:MAG TPA: 3'(2'),5'-bisphosphate nucleotidase CysQ [Terriglobales bacterium]|nr:3'(2'),5'-bisphosphate nucleotidase CysQ [Terriglobales bacterium]